MAEPIGLAASIITLAEVTTKLVKFITAVRDAPGEILALSNEAADTNLVVSEAQSLVQDGALPVERTKNLGKILVGMNRTVRHLDNFITSIGPTVGKRFSIHSIRWVVEKRKANALKDTLRKSKLDIIAIVTSTSL
jgi:hypothetical protein